MANSFANSMRNQGVSNWKLTENGADALVSTNSAVLDFYSVSGAIRNRSESDVITLFSKALTENPLLAMRSLFHARSIARNGKTGNGERKVFRTIYKWLANKYPQYVIRTMGYVPVFGRWDDLFELIGTKCENDMLEMVISQLNQDIQEYNDGDKSNISLASKWLPSINTSSKETVNQAKFFARKFGFTYAEYRKTLSTLRSVFNLVETKMSENKWEDIEFSHVPSQAMSKLRKAFSRHQPERFVAFLESVKKGEKKINAGTLTPSEIFEKMGFGSSMYGRYSRNSDFGFSSYDDALQTLWDNLPNYVEGNQNMLVMADTSGSMTGTPMNTAVSLAVYFAERNVGDFHNLFMTFSETPEFQEIKGKTLQDKVSRIKSIVANTNLEAAFDKILALAKHNNTPAEEMPKALIVISDMEFDQAQSRQAIRKNFTELMAEKFNLLGYDMPAIVYWDVAARQETFHANQNQKGVILVSGQSASTFKNVINVLNGNPLATPYDAMVEILNSQFGEIVV